MIRYRQSVLAATTLVALVLVVFSSQIANAATTQNGTLNGKVIVGVQGFYSCTGNTHWDVGSMSSLSSTNILADQVPIVSEFPASSYCPTPFSSYGGSKFNLYSDEDPGVAMTQTKWLADNGISVATPNIFIVNISDPTVQAHWDKLMLNYKAAAEANGTLFYITFDVSSGGIQWANWVRNEWKHYADLGILSSPNYLTDNGKPVVEIWGIGFAAADNSYPTDTNEVTQLISDLKGGNSGLRPATVIGGVPTHWRTLDGDSQTSPAWSQVYLDFDVISPWESGRFNDSQADSFFQNTVLPDIQYASSHGVRYMPEIWPSYSAYNLYRTTDPADLSQHPFNQVPGNCGAFLWHQVYNLLKTPGLISSMYVGMLDDYSENASIGKVGATLTDLPVGPTMLSFASDGCSVPNDWLLKATGAAEYYLKAGLSPINNVASSIAQTPYPTPPTPAAAATVQLDANGQSNLVINPGDTYAINWSSANAASCGISWSQSTDGETGSFNVIPNAAGSGVSSVVGTYEMTCTGTDGKDVSAFAYITQAAPLPAPSSISASCDASGNIAMSWPAVSGADYYLPVLYVPSSLNCPTYWTYGGMSGSNRECLLETNYTGTSVTAWSLPQGQNYIAYVYSHSGSDLSQTAAGPAYVSCVAAPPPPPQSQDPTGTIDVVTCSAIAGWADDSKAAATSIDVHLYDGSTFVGVYHTDQLRSDVNTALSTTGSHGFSITPPASLIDGKPHTLHLYAINTSGTGPNPEIGPSTKLEGFTCQPASVTANLTVNNSHEITVAPGDMINYAWTSAGATFYTSSYTVDSSDACGSLANVNYSWLANTPSGELDSALIKSCQAGHTYTYTYEVSDGNVKVPSSVIVHVANMIAAPTGLSSSCSSDGKSATFTWNAVSSASGYAIRLNDTTNDSASCTDGWLCSGSGDQSADNLTTTSWSAFITPGVKYEWWVHATKGSMWSAPTARGLFVTCNGPASPASPDGATLTPSSGGSLVAAGSTWTFSASTAQGGNVILRNSASIGAGNLLVVARGGQLFVHNTTPSWFIWSGAWQLLALSPNGSTLAGGTSGYLITPAGLWYFGPSIGGGAYKIMLNGKQAATGAGDLLYVKSGIMYARSAGSWYRWWGTQWAAAVDPTGGTAAQTSAALEAIQALLEKIRALLAQ